MTVRPTWLVASDMDGTVIPLDRAPEREEEIRALTTAVQSVTDLALAYVTGRSLPLATRGVEKFGLPPADFYAVDVGTRVYERSGDEYRPDLDYDARMVEATGGVDLDDVTRALDDLPVLEAQPDWQQGPFKRSYFVDPSIPDQALAERVRARLDREGARVALIISHDPLQEVGLLDILPHGVAKDAAVRHLQERTRAPLERVVYAGDSGNDMAAFLAGFSGIVVGNAPESLKRRLRDLQASGAEERRLYFAESPYAGGVVQGLRHYRVI